MIDAVVRAAVLENFPLGTPIVVMWSPGEGLAAAAAARDDPATVVLDRFDGNHPALARTPHVLLEGLDDVDDPALVLARLAAGAPHARLFALVSNAAHVRGLAHFFGGAALCRARPLLREDLDALFAGSGWRPLAITPLVDRSLSEAGGPHQVGELVVAPREPSAAERVRIAAYLVVADHA